MKLRENFREICVLSLLDFRLAVLACLRHDGHDVSKHQMEVVMNTHSDTRSEDLIDLGAVAVETKGTALQNIQDDGTVGANQKFPLMGSLSAD